MRTSESYFSLYRPAVEIREPRVLKAYRPQTVEILPAVEPNSVRVVLFLEFDVEGLGDEEGWKAFELAQDLARFCRERGPNKI